MDAELAARGADDDAILDDEGRDGRRLALREVGDPGPPQLLPGRRGDGHRVSVEQVVHDFAARVERAPIDRVTTGDAEGVRIHRGAVLPFERIALAREVERVQHVGIGRDNVHRVVDHEGLSLVPAQHASRERPHRPQARRVGGRDLAQVAVARGRVVVGRHRPAAALDRSGRAGCGRRQRGREHDRQRHSTHAHLRAPRICDRAPLASLPAHP